MMMMMTFDLNPNSIVGSKNCIYSKEYIIIITTGEVTYFSK